MKKASPLNYAFAIGVIRAQEKFLIRQEVFTEASEVSLQEALKLFSESGLYSDAPLHIQDSRQLEEFCNQELLKLKRLISGLLLDKELLTLLELKEIKCAEDILKKYPSEFLSDFLRHLIDLYNIKTFLRLYFLKEPKEKLEMELSSAGFIAKKTFLEVYGEDLSVFLERLEYVRKPNCAIVDYSAFLRPAIEKIKQENSFIALEKALNDFLIQTLKRAKYLSLGPEPLIAYYFAKVNEINLMRLIILSKLNNLQAELIKERLNLVYA